jgi:triphosphoribosyl-dephospho-CoA synthetase
MELDSYPDLSPEYFLAHKIAAKALVKYCLEFDRWRTAELPYKGLTQDLRRRGMLVPHLAGRPAPPERHSAN